VRERGNATFTEAMTAQISQRVSTSIFADFLCQRDLLEPTNASLPASVIGPRQAICAPLAMGWFDG
jgi:hypothetical protein